MKTIVCIFSLLLFLISCSISEKKCSDLELQNISLQKRIDSLETVTKELNELLLTAKLKRKTQSKAKNSSDENYDNTMIFPVKQNNVRNNYTQNKVRNSGQCMAITKKGARCTRTARSGGYCWQHGG